MKKIISIALAAVLALGLTACGNSDTLSGKVATDGSTSMEKVIGALKETFEGENKGVEVTYNPTGSSAGITAVSQNPGAIGYASVAAVKDTVKALMVGGVAPTNESVKEGSYAIQRPFLLVTKGELSETAKAFFDFITSEAAGEVITAAGVVPAN